MEKTIEIGDYKLTIENNNQKAHKATVTCKGKFCAEVYGETDYIALVKAVRCLITCQGNKNSLLVMLIQYGFETGFECGCGSDTEDLKVYLNDFKELYLDTKL